MNSSHTHFILINEENSPFALIERDFDNQIFTTKQYESIKKAIADELQVEISDIKNISLDKNDQWNIYNYEILLKIKILDDYHDHLVEYDFLLKPSWVY